MADYILALDQGTTSSKAILFDQAGRAALLQPPTNDKGWKFPRQLCAATITLKEILNRACPTLTDLDSVRYN